VVIILLVALAIAGAAISLGFAKSPSGSATLWFEVGKAGLQLVALGILGGLVALAFKLLDDLRDDRRRRDEYLASVTDELWGAYHRVKSVRRMLRAAGLRELLDAPRSDTKRSRQPSERQIADFREQMVVLNDAQLTLEKLKLGVKMQPSLYGHDHARIRRALRKAENYVKKVIEDWEDHGEDIKVGEDLDNVEGGLVNLATFLGKSGAPGANDGVGGIKDLSGWVEDAAAWIQSVRFGIEPKPNEAAEQAHSSDGVPSHSARPGRPGP